MMYKGVWLGLAGALLCAGCGGQRTIEEVQSLEYMDSREGKALVYPEGVDAPPQSSAYAIPPAPSNAGADEYDINELVRPPELFDHDELEEAGDDE